MEGGAVAPGERLQRQQAGVVEGVRAGQERRLAAGLAVPAQGQRGEADGTLAGLPVLRLRHGGRSERCAASAVTPRAAAQVEVGAGAGRHPPCEEEEVHWVLASPGLRVRVPTPAPVTLEKTGKGQRPAVPSSLTTQGL